MAKQIWSVRKNLDFYSILIAAFDDTTDLLETGQPIVWIIFVVVPSLNGAQQRVLQGYRRHLLTSVSEPHWKRSLVADEPQAGDRGCVMIECSEVAAIDLGKIGDTQFAHPAA